MCQGEGGCSLHCMYNLDDKTIVEDWIYVVQYRVSLVGGDGGGQGGSAWFNIGPQIHLAWGPPKSNRK